MVKITFPEMTKDEAKELVENRYGVMYWKKEPGRILAYPFETENPVIIETDTQPTEDDKSEICQVCAGEGRVIIRDMKRWPASWVKGFK